jgi:hypothetical protein
MLYALMKLKDYHNGGTGSDLTTAQACFSRALSFWDGHGFNDDVGPVHYDSYKTALGLYCLNFSELKSVSDAAGSHKLDIRSDFATVLQGSNGGIFGRYLRNTSNNTLYVEDTFENTESTSLMLLASPCV